MKKALIYITLMFCVLNLFSQNIVITDDDAYSAHSSAMLDVKATTKGLLIPRLTTTQRITIVSPATGLLVYDTNLNSFMYWNGSAWTNLSSGNANGIWGYSSPNVFLNNTNDRVGVGTTHPTGKMEVKADATLGVNDPIFHVVNKTGDTIFAVYDGGVRINVYDDPAVKASGNKGGFAVGGFTPSKGTLTNEYLWVTPDSVRIYIEENSTAKGNNNKGGFAVGGFTPSKLGMTNEYLRVTNDSTRIWTEDTLKGFGVGQIGALKTEPYLKINPDNYLIGHFTGLKITDAKYNVFLGYEAGFNTEGSDNGHPGGNSNIFIGYKAGFSNIHGNSNIYIGHNSGYSSTAIDNTFIGHFSGESTTTGGKNSFFGYYAGNKNSTGSENTFVGWNAGNNSTIGGSNVFVGSRAGMDNAIGQYNVYLGVQAGYRNNSGAGNVFIGYGAGVNNISGSGNIFIGNASGWYETGSDKLYIDNSDTNTPLIYGDFSKNEVTIHDVLILKPRATYPSGPVEGEIFVNSVDHHIYCYLNGSWKQLDN